MVVLIIQVTIFYIITTLKFSGANASAGTWLAADISDDMFSWVVPSL